MYRAVPVIRDRLFQLIDDEFGPAGRRPLLRTHEKVFIPRRQELIVPDLFPWAFHEVGRGSPRRTDGAYHRLGRIGVAEGLQGREGWYSLELVVVLIAMSSTGSFEDVISNAAFLEGIANAVPGALDLTGVITSYLYTNYNPEIMEAGSVPDWVYFDVPSWDAGGFEVLNHAIHREVAPDDTRLIKVWQINFTFEVLEVY